MEYISEWRVFSRLITLDPQPQDSISFSVVPQARCAGIRRTSVVSDQPFDSDLHCTHLVESRLHLSCTKNSQPKENADFRPISITSVLSRVTERLIVRQFFYTHVSSASRPHLTSRISTLFDPVVPLLLRLSQPSTA